MIRTVAIRAIGGYRAEYRACEDVDLWLRLAEIGRLANLPERLLKYRMHMQSLCSAQDGLLHEWLRAAAVDAFRRRGLSLPTDWESITKNGSKVGQNERLQRWAWWALSSGNRRTARKYALRSVRGNPLSRDTWKLVACCMRGY
jgi:hypothetical protein